MRLCTKCSRSWADTVDHCPFDGTDLASIDELDGTVLASAADPFGSGASAPSAPDRAEPARVGADQPARVTMVRASGQLAVAPEIVEELPAGTLVGDYRIERVIGTGGMGKVYGARHPVIGKRAAIKVLNASSCADRAAVGRFVQEAQAVNQIGHANIVDIFAFGVLPDGRSYLIMEWLTGETLAELQERRERLSVPEAVAILVPLMRALEAAHAAGVVHRDLKPENVFLVPEDDAFRVKLLDFGIAKLSTNRATTRRTATGVTMGTPLFMSPEQAKGLDVDARTDIYGLGVMAYLLVCGVTPFEHVGSPVEILHAHIHTAPRPPSELAPEVPAWFDALILELLAKDPGARPSLVDARRRLSRATTAPISGPISVPAAAPEPSTSPPSAPVSAGAVERSATAPAGVSRWWRWRWWLAASAIAAVALAAVVFVAVRDTATRDAPPAAPPATVSPPAGAPPMAPPVAVESPPAPAVGTLDLVIDPPVAEATIDGAEATIDQGRALIELPPGDHTLRVSAPGHRTREQRFAIVRAQVTPLKIQLARAPGGTGAKRRPNPKVDPDAVVDPFDRRRKP